MPGNATDSRSYPNIDLPYLIIGQDPYYKKADGSRYLHRLWARDLEYHFPYLRQLTLASPTVPAEELPPEDLKAVEAMDTSDAKLQVVELPPARSLGQVILNLPRTVSTLWKAIKQAKVVHIDIFNGWPIAYGWLAVPMAKMQGKFVVTLVETDILQGSDSGPMTAKKRLRIAWSDLLAKWCAKRVDLAYIGIQECQPKFFADAPERCHLFPPSWVSEEDLIPEDQAIARWDAMLQQPLRLVFAARLRETKGVRVLIETMKLLEKRGVDVELDVYGMGELEDEVRQAENELQGKTKLNFKGTVAYGKDFFAMLGEYHAVLIPSMSNEQPRIVLDSFSQALPAIASDTSGLRAQINHEKTGLLFPIGDARALADAISRIAKDRDALKAMGIAALKENQKLTIGSQHSRRAKLLEQALQEQGLLT